MIQELLGGGNSTPTRFYGEREISSPFTSLASSSPICPPTAPPLLTATPISTPNGSPTPLTNSNSPNGGNNNNNNNNNNTNTEASNNNGQNLRCPRCDSTNTKFCYYNNYNLTQPRHFCKTCRRYWTKGGTLRNVPIGGGCRKNKAPISSNSSATSGFCKSSANHAMAKAKATLSSEMLVNDNSLFIGNGLLDHQLQQNGSNQILWSSLPQAQNSHILSLLRGTSPFSNPNPNPTSDVLAGVKTECPTTPTTLGLNSYDTGAPSQMGPYTRSNHHQLNGFNQGIADFAQINGNSASNSNILDLYQRLKSSSGYGYCGSENPGALILGNMMSSSASSGMNSSGLDATSIGGGGGGDHGFGGYKFMTPPAMSNWSDFPAVPIHGAYP